MSALARYYHHIGWQVSGYDKTESILTKKLVSEGLTIQYDDRTDTIPLDAELYVFTPAIDRDFVILKYLRDLGKTLLKRSEVLGILSRQSTCLAVAGTHGKTTTAAILTHLLHELGANPSAFVGGIMKNYQSNFLAGRDDLIVVEADEYDRSFLQLTPSAAIITSLDPDHLDIYGDFGAMQESFEAFAKMISDDGLLFQHEAVKLESPQHVRHRIYGDNGSYRLHFAERQKDNRWKIGFQDDEAQYSCSWSMPGKHNAHNALAAFGLLREMGYEPMAIMDALSSFEGIERRYEIIAQDTDRTLIMDYAHHPSELRAALDATRHHFDQGEEILAVFQPHLYSRTADFHKEFAQALDAADEVMITEIYPAREEPMDGVTSDIILRHMDLEKVRIIDSKAVSEELKDTMAQVILILGAGDLDQHIEKIKNTLFKS